jgi:hypothetical protein
LGASDPTLRQFEGNIESSPYYNNLVRLGLEDTSREFDQMLGGVRSRARQSGFGYEQPASQAGEESVRIAEAGELARVRPEAYAAAIEPSFRAAGMRSQRAGILEGAQEQEMATAADLENQRRNRRAALWGSLMGAGAKVASSFAPHPGG